MERWLNRSITNEQRLQLKQEYIERNNFDRLSCTTCPAFWADVKHFFRYLLKQNGIITVEKQPKYILAEGVGEIRTFGSGTHYVMEGEESPTTVILTDEIAERLLETNPGVKEQLIPNPAYKEPDASEGKKAVTTAKTKEPVTLTAKEKKALKAEQEAAKLATVTPADELIAPVISNDPETAEGSISQDVVIPVV